jgi:hypothetical protein
MGGPAGEPLVTPLPNQSEASLQTERDKVWNTFAAQFVGN